MKVRINLVITCLLLAVGSIHAQSIWDGAHLQKVKQSLHQPYFSTTYQELVAEAEKLPGVFSIRRDEREDARQRR